MELHKPAAQSWFSFFSRCGIEDSPSAVLKRSE